MKKIDMVMNEKIYLISWKIEQWQHYYRPSITNIQISFHICWNSWTQFQHIQWERAKVTKVKQNSCNLNRKMWRIKITHMLLHQCQWTVAQPIVPQILAPDPWRLEREKSCQPIITNCDLARDWKTQSLVPEKRWCCLWGRALVGQYQCVSGSLLVAFTLV